MNDNFIDFYELFGVTSTATSDEIKKAYRKKIKEVHPDIATDDSTEDTCKLMNIAYSILSNPKQRAEYDQRYQAYYQAKKEQEESEKVDYDELIREFEEELRQYEEELHAYRRAKRQERTFSSRMKRAYQTVKKEEYRNKGRHEKLDRDIYKDMWDDEFTVPEEIVFHIGRGTIHVCAEILYQFSKLGIRKKDSFSKYIIRNRGLIGFGLAGFILVNGLTGQFSSNIMSPKDENIAYGMENDDELAEYGYVYSVTLTRNYTIKAGDTLSQMAEDANTPMSTIKSINNYTNDRIYMGDEIVIPYTITTDDLQYYTEVISVGETPLYEIANKYETDVETLMRLNEEAIQRVGNTYAILSDSIVVPKFISRKEYEETKSKNTYQYKKY